MRLFIKHCTVAVAVATVALACKSPPPAAPNPPQRPFNEPTVQQPNDPLASNIEGPQKPLTTPKPQKPFYGPGTSPEEHVLAKTEKPLTDSEVIGAAIAANDGEVQMAEMAIKKAHSAEVKKFAELMKTSHATEAKKARALEAKAKITSAESDVSSYLKNEVSSTLKDLRDKEGKGFDRAYMESQVKAHKDVLAAIENRLIPSAKSDDLKNMLTELQREVADHLSKAEAIEKKLESTASMRRRSATLVAAACAASHSNIPR